MGAQIKKLKKKVGKKKDWTGKHARNYDNYDIPFSLDHDKFDPMAEKFRNELMESEMKGAGRRLKEQNRRRLGRTNDNPFKHKGDKFD